jgi:plasmid maintenance system killer protein
LEITFEDAALARNFQSEREMLKKFGKVRTKRLQVRLKQLQAAETLADMHDMSGRFHELHGDRAGQLSLDLDGPYRLLFRPAGDVRPGQGGGLDWSACTVVVVGIVDTHD